MTKFKIVVLVSFIILSILLIANLILIRLGYQFNFEFWTSIKANIMLFALTGLAAYLMYILYVKKAILKLIGSIFALLSLLFLGFIALWGSEDVKVIENSDYKIYIVEYRFLFDGEDTLYQKENFLFSKKIGTYTQSDDNNVSYEIVEDQLLISDKWYRYPEEDLINIYYIDLE
ncbi:MAG: hypothetical protein WCY80_02510 [Candidatus Izemoplasmatales bacterium]